MATVEQLLEEARKLPAEQLHRLRNALEALETNGDTLPSYRSNHQERVWIDAHRDEYLGQWVALQGDRLVAHGTDAKAVYDEARNLGIASPYLEQVAPKEAAFIGGWH